MAAQAVTRPLTFDDCVGADIEKYRAVLAPALALGGSHRFEDVVKEVIQHTMQFWSYEKSCVISQISHAPLYTACHIFLGAGELSGIEAIAPVVEAWAREQGCTRMQFIGRPGWDRTFLNRQGWTTTAICMEKSI